MNKLAVDIGNSYTHLGVFSKKLNRIISISTEDTSIKDIDSAFFRFIHDLKIERSAISSVVPEKEKLWNEYIMDSLQINPLIINNKSKLPIKIKVKNSETVGADRICNAVSGYQYFNRKSNVVIIDMGTAVTIDVVMKNGDFRGGIIMPGVWTSAKSLFINTGKLPLISEKELSFPHRITGDNTKDAIKSGLMNSVLFALEGYIKAIRKEFNAEFKVIVSGGISQVFHKKFSFKPVYIKNTVLDGLNVIMNNN